MACSYMVCVFFFKQKTAYEMRISDWSSDVCSSDLGCGQSHDWYVERFSSEVDAQVHRLPEHQQAYALQIAEEYGDYATPAERQATQEIGRASCRERVWQYVSSSVVAVSLKKNTKRDNSHQSNDTEDETQTIH